MRIESPFGDDRRALHFEPESKFVLRYVGGYKRVVLLQATEAAAAASKELAATNLDVSRRRDLEQVVARGIRAKNTLAAVYLHEAEYYARRLAETPRGRRHEVDDLMQEALLGLLWTIDNFDRESRVGFDNIVGHMMQRAARRSLGRRTQPTPDPEGSDAVAA